MILIPFQKLSSSPWHCLDCRSWGKGGKFYWVNADFQIVFLHIVLVGIKVITWWLSSPLTWYEVSDSDARQNAIRAPISNILVFVFHYRTCRSGTIAFSISFNSYLPAICLSYLIPFCNCSYHIIYVFAKWQTASFFCTPLQGSFFKLSYHMYQMFVCKLLCQIFQSAKALRLDWFDFDRWRSQLKPCWRCCCYWS